jgi:uncharacterized SAM-binding protein YcdF (DUF218 family)
MYWAIRDLLLPLPLACLLLLAGLVRWWRLGARARVTLPGVVLLLAPLYLSSNPLVAGWLTGTLERQHAPVGDLASTRADAIVVLSGGFRRGYDGNGELAEDTTVRLVHAIGAYRAVGPLPLVVTGGLLASGPDTPVAEAMVERLAALGIPRNDVLVEPRSETTFENAQRTWRLLSERRARRILLVTDALHMPRSVAVFERQGFDVVPHPCTFVSGAGRWSIRFLIPSARSAEQIARASHEWIGLVWYRLNGRI